MPTENQIISSLNDSIKVVISKHFDKHLQLVELKSYTNNTARCLDILDLISGRRKNHQQNTLMKFYTLIISKEFTNKKNYQQETDLNLLGIIPPTIFRTMYPSKNEKSSSNEKI